jgi:ribosomal protein L40E
MTFRFTRGWAQMLLVLGIVVIILGVALAGAITVVPIPWTDHQPGTIERAFLAATVVAGGVVLGGSLIVTGQLLLAFLSLHQNIERLARRFASEDAVPCMYCGEAISADATVCRYCRSDLTRPTAADRLLTPR